MSEFYSAKEAREKLGLSNAMFHRKVGQGHIPRVVQPGKKLGVYPKRDIDALAMAMDVTFSIHPQHYQFSKSSPGDQVEEMEIGIRCFGQEYITPLAERIAFQQKNEYTFWSLKVDRRVVGYATIFRFPEDFLDDILTGRKIERQITVKEVLPFERLVPFNVYIDVLATDPRLSEHERTLYGGWLPFYLTERILDFLSNGYLIQKVYTVTATKEGDTLVRKAGFREMVGKSIAPGRVAYEYPLDTEGIAALKEKIRLWRHLA
jgi:predicted DNA-binding transcriptional regulator AlpA